MPLLPGSHRAEPLASDGRPMRPRNFAHRESADSSCSARTEPRSTLRTVVMSAPGNRDTGEAAGPPGALRDPDQVLRFLTIRMIAGPRMTMNSDGKMHPTSGNSIL